MTRCKHVLTLLAALALALAFASGAGAHGLHHDLGDDSIFDVTRDVSADVLPSTFLFDQGAAAAAPASQRGCQTKFLTTNFSSRAGVRPKMNVAHLTVSRNQPGWSDVNAIWSHFNRAATDASSNYIIDAEGNCLYAVPEDAKAWTQGAFNPSSISIEFIHFSTTDPNEHWTEAQLRKGAMVFADASKRWGIPIRLVNPVGCTVVAGLTDHDRLECENTHVDVGTREAGTGVHRGTFPMTKFLSYIKEAAAPPVQIVHFALGTAEGRGIAKSMGVQVGPNELGRLRDFLAFRAPAALKELRADGDINVIRRKGKP